MAWIALTITGMGILLGVSFHSTELILANGFLYIASVLTILCGE